MEFILVASISSFLETNNSFQRMTRFMIVGALGTLVDFSVFAILHTLFGVPILIANTISYSAGIVNNFVLHRRWTFAHQAHKTLHIQFLQFVIVSFSAWLINTLVVLSLTPWFDAQFAHVGYGALVAKLCATGVGMIWNFIANNFWTFRIPSNR